MRNQIREVSKCSVVGLMGLIMAATPRALAQPYAIQHLTIRKQHGGVARVLSAHVVSGGPTRDWIVEHGACQRDGVVGSPRDQYLAIGEQRGGMPRARRAHTAVCA